jgi:hypothetical protein
VRYDRRVPRNLVGLVVVTVMLSACGTSSKMGSGTGDAQQPMLDGLPPLPPSLPADITSISLVLPASRILPYVPSQYVLDTVPSLAGPVTSLYILMSNFAGGDGYAPYQEVAYMVVVTGPDHQQGVYFLRLHLNSQLAIDIGIQVYGYPKVYADVSYTDEDGTLSVRATKDGQALLSADTVISGPTVPYASPPYFGHDSFFVRRGMLVHAPTTLDVSQATPRALTHFDVPYLVSAGFVTQGEWPTVLAGAYAYTMPHAVLHLGAPVDDGPVGETIQTPP